MKNLIVGSSIFLVIILVALYILVVPSAIEAVIQQPLSIRPVQIGSQPVFCGFGKTFTVKFYAKGHYFHNATFKEGGPTGKMGRTITRTGFNANMTMVTFTYPRFTGRNYHYVGFGAGGGAQYISRTCL